MKKILFFLLVLFVSANAYAAKIELKSGLSVEGEIVEQTNRYVKINFEGVDLKFYFDEIDTVDGEVPNVQDYPEEETKLEVFPQEEEDYSEIFEKSREKSAESYGVSKKLTSLFEKTEEIEISDEASDEPILEEAPDASATQLPQEDDFDDLDPASKIERRIQQDLSQMKQFLKDKKIPFVGFIVDFFGDRVRARAKSDPAYARKILEAKSFKERAENDESAQSAKIFSLKSNKSGSIIPFIFGAIFVFFTIICWWIICNKAGYPGWSQLIPIYGQYVQCKIAGKPGWWLLLFFVPYVSIIFYFIIMIGIAKNFGKGAFFGLGLIFLPFIFGPILAFDGSEYALR
ncbi:MAG: DUF5684 domain-containing protein [Candidatus Aceula meridiana]|nr:DUF5684 domain-containing protein [Candidatus Aceula meridiana]